jgi:hypothetical protein
MGDTTKAAKMLNEFGSPSIPPPPSSGTLPFSIPFSDSKQGFQLSGIKNSSTAAVAAPSTPPAGKWVEIKEKCSKVLKTQGIAALVVFVIVAGIMAAVNPPIVQTKSTNPDDKPKRSILKILIWATVAAALAMVIPIGIEYAKKKKLATVTVNSGGSTTIAPGA